MGWLCRHAFERGARVSGPMPAPGRTARLDLADGVGPRLLHAAYFHCQQADRFYAALLDARWEDVRLRTARASILASIGLLLEQHGPPGSATTSTAGSARRTPSSPATLQPSAGVTRSVLVGRFTRPALRYYRRALALLPDDTVLRCREATAALALTRGTRSDGSCGPWRTSRRRTSVLADSYRDQALRYLERAAAPGPALPAERRRRPSRSRGRSRRPSSSLALDEYREALERDPTSATALTQFARVFWEWRQAAADRSAPGARVWPTRGRRSGTPAARSPWSRPSSTARPQPDPGRSLARPRGRSWPIRSRRTFGSPPRSPWPASARCCSARPGPRGPRGPRVRRGARARAPGVRRRPLDARPGVALRRRRGSGARTSRPRCAADRNWRETNSPRLEAIDALRQEAAVVARPRAGPRASARGASVRRPHGHRRVAERVPRGLARNGQRAGGSDPVRPQAGGGRRAAAICAGRLGVRAPRLSGEKEKVYLRVWGGGVERLRLESGARRSEAGSDVVSLAPTTSRFYYFAQLENEDGRRCRRPWRSTRAARPPGRRRRRLRPDAPTPRG